jgi:hypothetical protein
MFHAHRFSLPRLNKSNRIKHDHALPHPASNLSFLWSRFRKSKTTPLSTNENIHPNLSNSAGATSLFPLAAKGLGWSDTAMNCHSSSHAKGRSAPSASTVASSSSSASALSLIRPPESRCGSGIATDATHQVEQFNANDEATEGNQSTADPHCPSDEISYWLGKQKWFLVCEILDKEMDLKLCQSKISLLRDDLLQSYKAHAKLCRLNARNSTKIDCLRANIIELQEEIKRSHAECRGRDFCNTNLEAENTKLQATLRTFYQDAIEVSKKFDAIMSGSPAEQVAVAKKEASCFTQKNAAVGKQTAPVTNDTATTENQQENSLVPMPIPLFEGSSDANVLTTDHHNDELDDKATIAEFHEEIHELQSQQTRFVNCLHDEREKNKALNIKLELYAAALGYHHASNIVQTEQLNWSARCMREALRLRDQKLSSAQLNATTEKHQSK